MITYIILIGEVEACIDAEIIKSDVLSEDLGTLFCSSHIGGAIECGLYLFNCVQ